MPREWRVLGFELKWNRDLGQVSLHLPKLIDGNFATEKRNFQFPSLAASERQSINEGNVAFVLFNILPRELEFQSSRNVIKWVTSHERLWAEPQGVYDNDFSSFRVDVVINDNLIFMISWDRNLTVLTWRSDKPSARPSTLMNFRALPLCTDFRPWPIPF